LKDLIEKILVYLPRYLSDFGSLFTGPKRFIAGENTLAEDALSRALLFLSISLVLVVVGRAPVGPADTQVWATLGSLSVACIVGVSLSAVALRFAWRIVGGKAPFRSFFVTYSYFFGVLLVLLSLFQILGLGVLKFFEKELFEYVAKGDQNQIQAQFADGIPATFWVFLAIFFIGMVVTSVWSFLAWGAYRELNGLSRMRSFLAMMVMGMLSIPVGLIVFFIAGLADP